MLMTHVSVLFEIIVMRMSMIEIATKTSSFKFFKHCFRLQSAGLIYIHSGITVWFMAHSGLLLSTEVFPMSLKRQSGIESFVVLSLPQAWQIYTAPIDTRVLAVCEKLNTASLLWQTPNRSICRKSLNCSAFELSYEQCSNSFSQSSWYV